MNQRNYKIRINNITLKKNVILMTANHSNQALRSIEPKLAKLGYFRYTCSYPNKRHLRVYYLPQRISRNERITLSRKGHMAHFYVVVDIIQLSNKRLQKRQTGVK